MYQRHTTGMVHPMENSDTFPLTKIMYRLSTCLKGCLWSNLKFEPEDDISPYITDTIGQP